MTDLHLRGVRPICTFEEASSKIVGSLFPVLANGDVVDLANCWKKELPQAHQELTLIRAKVKFSVRGNHECNQTNDPDELYLDEARTILAAHGDIPCWGKARSDAFRSQSPGAGFFKRYFISLPIDELRHLITVRPSDSEKAWIEQKKKENPGLKTAIFGHNHPDHVILYFWAGVFAGIFPQGFTDIRIEDTGEIILL